MEDRLYTLKDWATLEAESPDRRYEFVEGRLIAMAGGTLRHAEIKARMADAVRRRLGGRCSVTESDVRLETVGKQIYRLPDIVVYCGEPELVHIPGVGEAITNPTLLVEVLSESTSREDLEEKLIEYMALPSLLEYWVVDPERVRVLQFVRGVPTEGSISLVAYTSEGARLRSEVLELEIPLEAIYRV